MANRAAQDLRDTDDARTRAVVLSDHVLKPRRRPDGGLRRKLVVGGILFLVCWAMLSPVLWTATRSPAEAATRTVRVTSAE